MVKCVSLPINISNKHGKISKFSRNKLFSWLFWQTFIFFQHLQITMPMPKEGHKQAVLRKNVLKKWKGSLRGTSSGMKKHQNWEKQPRVGITFVSEDNVVSKQISLPAVPASSWKIQVFETESSSEENSYVGLESAHGHCLLSMDILQKFCNKVHSHSSCSSDESKVIITKVLFYLKSICTRIISAANCPTC